MTTSAVVLINGSPLSTSGVTGYNATPGSTVIIELANPANVENWVVTVLNSDGYNPNTAVNLVAATLVRTGTITYTVTAPNLNGNIGGSNIFQSVTTDIDGNQNLFTFGIWEIGTNSSRTFIGGENLESNITVGVAYDLNVLVAKAAVGGGGGGGSPTGPASGDLGGFYPSPKVTGLQGFAIDPVTPTVGYILQYNIDGLWTPTSPASVSSVIMGGDITGTSNASIVSKIDGYTLPTPGNTTGVLQSSGTALTWGQVNLASNSYVTGVLATGHQASQNLTLTGDISGSGTTAGTTTTLATVNSSVGTFGNSTQVGTFTVDGKGRITAASNVTISGSSPGGSAGGDLSGSYPNPSVVKIQGNPVQAVTLGATQDGYFAEWVNASSQIQFKPLSLSAPQVANYQFYSTPGSTTWLCPVGVYFVSLTMSGGGGGGGCGASGSFGGGGGASGVQLLVNNVPVSPGTTYTINVGAGGIGGDIFDAPATVGGTTSFSGGTLTTISAPGGNPGQSEGGFNQGLLGGAGQVGSNAGGNGGNETNGFNGVNSMYFTGGIGGTYSAGENPLSGAGGGGGAGTQGNGGNGGNNLTSDGYATNGVGGGGGGGSGLGRNGGNGGAGYLVLSWAGTTGMIPGGDLGGNEFSQTLIAIDGYSLPNPGNHTGFLYSSGTSLSWNQLSGDVSNSVGLITVTSLQGNAVKSGINNSSEDGYVLTWINSASQYQLKPTVSAFIAAGDLTGNSSSQTVVGIQGNKVKTVTLGSSQDGYVATWVNADGYIEFKPAAVSGITQLTGDATAGPGSGSQAITLATVNSSVGSFGSATQVATFTVNAKGLITAAGNTTISGVAPGGAAGGDLGGTYPNPTIAKLDGYSLPSPIPGVLQEISGSLTWAPVNLASATYVSGILPIANQANQNMVGDVTGTTGANILSSIDGYALPNPGNHTGLLHSSGTALTWSLVSLTTDVTGILPIGNQANQTLVGDVTGNTGAAVVVALQGNAVQLGTNGASQDGYVLTWHNSSSQYQVLPLPSPVTSVTMGGDVTGNSSTSTVVKIQGKTLNSALATIGASQDGYALTWVNGSGDWEAKPLPVNAITALTGDITATGPGSVAATLATVNSSVGTFGDATHVGTFTVNGKGLITAASSTAITYPQLNIVTQATKTANYAMVTTDNVILTDSTSNTIQITLPTPTAGLVVTIKDKTGQAETHNVTVVQNGSETIDGLTSYIIAVSYGSVSVISDGTNWSVI